MNEPDHIRAHRHSIRNRDELLRSASCGCFFCLAVFTPGEIADWADEKDGSQTALCPRCRIDSVIGSESGYPITREFLERMEAHWFGLLARRPPPPRPIDWDAVAEAEAEHARGEHRTIDEILNDPDASGK
jgi:hypothetical protein